MKVDILTASSEMLDLLVAWVKFGYQQEIEERKTGNRVRCWSDSDILQWARMNQPSSWKTDCSPGLDYVTEVISDYPGYNFRTYRKDYFEDYFVVLEIWKNCLGQDSDSDSDSLEGEVFTGKEEIQAWLRCYLKNRVGSSTVDLPNYFTGRVTG